MKKFIMKDKLVLIEGGLHKLYRNIYYILNDLFDLKIVTSDKKNFSGIKLFNLEEKSFFIPSFRYYKGLYSFLKKEGPDIVSTRVYYRPYAIIALFYTIFHKKKFIVMEEQRNDPHRFVRKIIFQILLLLIKPVINWKAHKIICITKSCYEYMKRKGFKKVEYIPVPYYPTQWPEIVDNTQKKLKIISVARFEWLKGHEILIKALSHLIYDLKFPKKDIEINLVGEGSLKKQIVGLVNDLGLKDIVHFVGYIPNEKLDVFYRQHNLFVLSSVSDPVGMVVLEAMSNGLPVIVSSNVGGKDAIQEGRNGYIFKSGDYIDLAKKILLLRSPIMRQKFGEESIKILKEERNINKIKELYYKIISNDYSI